MIFGLNTTSRFERHMKWQGIRLSAEYYELVGIPQPEEETVQENEGANSNSAPTEDEYDEWEDNSDVKSWETDDDVDWDEDDGSDSGKDNEWNGVSVFDIIDDVDEGDSESTETDITYIESESSFVGDENSATEDENASTERECTLNGPQATSANNNNGMVSTAIDNRLQAHETKPDNDNALERVREAVREAKVFEDHKRKDLLMAHQQDMKTVRAHATRPYHSLLAMQQENESLKIAVEVLVAEVDKLSRVWAEETRRVLQGPGSWTYSVNGSPCDSRDS